MCTQCVVPGCDLYTLCSAATDVVKQKADVPKPTPYDSKSLRRTASMRRKKMHAVQQPPGTPVRPHPTCYVSMLGSAIRLLLYAALAAAPPLVTPTNHVTPVSDHDVADKKQPNTSAATSGADLEQENQDLKREVGLR